MSALGRRDFLSVIAQTDVICNWPESQATRFDSVLIAPDCDDVCSLLYLCAQHNVRRAIVGPHCGSASEQKALSELRASGCSVLGPGSCGFFNCHERCALCWSPAITDSDLSSCDKLCNTLCNKVKDGHVTLIAHGGAFPFSLYAMLRESRVRFQSVVSLGSPVESESQQNSDAILFQCMQEAIQSPETQLLLLSLGSLHNGGRFLELLRQAAKRNLPVALLRWGTALLSSGSVSEDANTGIGGHQIDAAWTDSTMWESVARQFGVILIDDIQQMIDLSKLSALPHRASGNRVAVVGFSESMASLQSDQCSASGLVMPAFSDELREKLQRIIHEVPARINTPGDMTFDAGSVGTHTLRLSENILSDYHGKSPSRFLAVLNALQSSDEIDMVLVIAGVLNREQSELFSAALVQSQHSGTKPVVCCCIAPWNPLSEMIRTLNDGNVPLFSSPRRAAETLNLLWQRRYTDTVSPASYTDQKESILKSMPELLSEKDAMCLVQTYGLKTVTQRFCTSMAEVLEASRAIGFPLVMKVVSPSFVSKQQARAVALHLRTEEELRNAYGRVLERVSRLHPEAVIEGVCVQKMITDGFECMIGLKRDPLFGPVVAVAPGGAFYGLMKDIALRIAPVSKDTALDMIRSLKGFQLISGQWYGTPLDIDALADQIVALSHLACAEPDISLLDINPVFIRPHGAEIADAFAVRTFSSVKEPGTKEPNKEAKEL